MEQKKRLGRGLSALFGDDEQPTYNVAYAGDNNTAQTDKANTNNTQQNAAPAAQNAPAAKNTQSVLRVPITALQPSRFQPRRTFNQESLAELASSLKQHGVLQPLLVRALETPSETGAIYEIIAGERRWRAAQMVPLHDLPIHVREFTPEQALQIALIENLQREDLNPVEEANGYQRLLDEYQYTQDDLAQVIGKSRSHISNMLRMLTLDKTLLELLTSGKLTAGHARVLIKAKDPQALADIILKKNLSVRDAEKLAQIETQKYRPSLLKPTTGKTPGAFVPGVAAPAGGPKTADVMALEKSISDMLGLTVEIETGKNMAGKIVINYKDLDQLDEVLRRLSR